MVVVRRKQSADIPSAERALSSRAALAMMRSVQQE
jgi:hypothetical protein